MFLRQSILKWSTFLLTVGRPRPNECFLLGPFLTKRNDFLDASKIKGIDTDVLMVILVYDGFLVSYPKSAENGPSKLVFRLVNVLRRFWSPVGRTALKMVLSILYGSTQ